MSFFFDFFRKKSETAQTAKDRLQIIVARERASAGVRAQSYLPKLQQELLEVISKYEKLDLDLVTVNLDRRGQADVLEINIVLPPELPKERPVRPGGVAPVGA